MTTASIPQPAALATNLQCDVCVVGAGIAGLTTAYLLAREGRKVIVLDRSLVGGGETSRTTAHLSYVIDDGLHETERVERGHAHLGDLARAERDLAEQAPQQPERPRL